MKFNLIDESYANLLETIETYFSKSNNSIHKARNEIKIIDYNSENLVVKSFKTPNIFNKIVYTFFKQSKAEKSYINSVKIIDFVPKPIGFIEFKKFGLINKSYFISENFDYSFTIREPLLNENFTDKKNIFKAFAKFSMELHNNGILHLDYSPGNILIKQENGTYIFKIVDINRMQFKSLDLDERLKNFAKLWAKDDDLIIIIKEYSTLINEDETTCISKALKFSQAHKDRKNAKKRLRGQKVVD